jgi:crotonobetainyl-CoA:carnitine CoA-transferase CaiB-like acyl-CoA transferase
MKMEITKPYIWIASSHNMLNGVRVVEVASFYPAPFCTQILAMLGAEVIKVEPPQGEPARLLDAVFAALNRGKKSVTINLKSEEGRKKFFELAKDADVIVESFRPGVVKKLGIDYESIKKVNPSIIYCSLSAYGQNTKLKHVPAHDINTLALGGILEVSGFGEPRDPNVQLADFSSSMYATIMILSSLYEKEKTGKGRYIDISMFHSALFSIPLHSAPLLNGMEILPAFSSNPVYGIYRTKDGYITIGIIAEEHFWKRLCKALGLDYSFGLFESFFRHEEVRKEIQSKLETMSTDEAVRVLLDADIPVMDVKTLKKIEEIEETIGEKLTEEVEYRGRRYRIIKPPFPSVRLSPPPELGK